MGQNKKVFFLQQLSLALAVHGAPQAQHLGLQLTGNFLCRQILSGSRSGSQSESSFVVGGLPIPSFPFLQNTLLPHKRAINLMLNMILSPMTRSISFVWFELYINGVLLLCLASFAYHSICEIHSRCLWM